jgi:hypothetical protein
MSWYQRWNIELLPQYLCMCTLAASKRVKKIIHCVITCALHYERSMRDKWTWQSFLFYRLTVEVSLCWKILSNSGKLSVPGNFAVENTVVGLLEPLNASTFDWQIASRSCIFDRRHLSDMTFFSRTWNMLSIIIRSESREWTTSFMVSGSQTS